MKDGTRSTPPPPPPPPPRVSFFGDKLFELHVPACPVHAMRGVYSFKKQCFVSNEPRGVVKRKKNNKDDKAEGLYCPAGTL